MSAVGSSLPCAEVRLGEPPIRPDGRGIALDDHLAEVEHVDVVADVEHQRDVVIDQQHAGAGCRDVADAGSQATALGGVEAGGRLVEQQHRGLGHVRPCDRHELALALAELLGVAIADAR